QTAQAPAANDGYLVHFVAAAAVLAGAVMLLFKLYPSTNPFYRPVISHCDSILIYRNGIPPGVDKASLTLNNGDQLVLDSTLNNLVAIQGSSLLRRLKTGEYQYTTRPGPAPDSVLYNTITTSRGTQCIILLPDGSTAR